MKKKKLITTMALAITLTVSSVFSNQPTIVYAEENINGIEDEENVVEETGEETIPVDEIPQEGDISSEEEPKRDEIPSGEVNQQEGQMKPEVESMQNGTNSAEKSPSEEQETPVMNAASIQADAVSLMQEEDKANEETVTEKFTGEVTNGEQLQAIASILNLGLVAEGDVPTSEQQNLMKILGIENVDTADLYNQTVQELQTTDISILNDINLPEDFLGIGTEDVPFMGNVNGNGNSVLFSTNLEVNQTAYALFSHVSSVNKTLTFQNIVLEGSITITGTCASVASLIGSAQGTNKIIVDNCINYADVISKVIGSAGKYACASGLLVKIQGELELTDCMNYGNIECSLNLNGLDLSKQYHAGSYGLLESCGMGVIKGCTNEGNVTVDGCNYRQAAGIAGNVKKENSYLDNCLNKGKIEVKNSVEPVSQGSKVYAGGILAKDNKVSLNVSNCKNAGEIRVYSGSITNDVNWNHHSVGGIAGEVQGTYENCVNEGNVTVEMHMGGNPMVGGIVGGQQLLYNFINCQNYGDISLTYSTTKTPAYPCVGGIVGMTAYNQESKDCVNEGDIAVKLGNSITSATYIGGFRGKVDNAADFSLSNFENNSTIKVESESSAPIFIGGVQGDTYRATIENSNICQQVDTTGGTPYVGGITGGNPSPLHMSSKNNVIKLDASHHGSNAGSYIGALAGKAVVHASDTTVILTTEGFEKVTSTSGEVTTDQPYATINNLIVYSDEELNNVDQNAISGILNDGYFHNDSFETGKLSTPVKEDCIFKGWYDNKECIGNAVTIYESGKTYFAKWEKSQYQVVDVLDFGNQSYGSTAAKEITVSLPSGTAGNSVVSSVESSNENVFTATVDNKDTTKVIVTPNELLSVGSYEETLCIVTEDGAMHNVTLKITIGKADSELSVQTDKAVYYYGDKIQVKVEPKIKTIADNENTIGLFAGEVLLAENNVENGVCILEYDTTKGLIKPSGKMNLEVRYTGNDGLNPSVKTFEIEYQPIVNTWVEAASITGWVYGEAANKPIGKAAFGDTVFTYSSEESGTYTEKVPTNAGVYYMKASVAGAETYTGLEEKIRFEIKKAIPTPEKVTGITIKKGAALETVKLPKGFAWENGKLIVEELGNHEFKAIYTPEDTVNYETINVSINVEVVAESTNPTDPEKPDPEQPNTEKPDPEQPNPEKPDTEEPNTEQPTDPQKPDGTDDGAKPGTDDKNPSSDVEKPEAGKDKAAVTGDETNMILYLGAAFASVLVISAAVIVKLKQRKKSK